MKRIGLTASEENSLETVDETLSSPMGSGELTKRRIILHIFIERWTIMHALFNYIPVHNKEKMSDLMVKVL